MNEKLSPGDKVFHFIIVVFMLIVIMITIYPFWYVIVASFSDANELSFARGIIWTTQGFSTQAYQIILNNLLLWKAYLNTIIYTTAGTALNVFLTTLGAYVLSRRGLVGRNFLMKVLVFTMYFGGGLIPTYLQMDRFGLVNNPLIMILPGAVSVYNLIIVRTAFLGVPPSLEEAAVIDGASPNQILWNVTIPLAMPTIMVVGLYYLVGHWNSYMDALIYLRDSNKYPLQLVLRNILIQNDPSETMGNFSFIDTRIVQTVKYAAIIVSIIPVLIVYPFIQKYFVQGTMIGAIKG